MKKLKYICIFSLILACMLFTSSCSVITLNFDKIFPYDGTVPDGGPETDIPKEENTAETEAPETNAPKHEYTGAAVSEKYLSEIGSYSFDGHSIFIKTTADGDAISVLSPTIEEGETADTYSKAVYERNKIVEERFNCEFHYSVTTVEEMIADIKAAIKDEGYYADLLAVSQNELYMLIKEDYLYNLRSLPYLDMNAEYFNPYSVNALSAGYHDYGVISYATIDPDVIRCVYVNADFADAEAVKTLIKEGRYTWGELLNASKWQKVSFSDKIELFPEIVYASAGLEFVNNENRSAPTVRLPDSALGTRDVVTWLLRGWEILAVTETHDEETGEITYSGGLSEFVSGTSSYHIGTLGETKSLADVSFDWYVFPMPSYAAGGKNLSYMPPETLTLSVPINTSDPDGASVLLRALSAASYGYLKDAYVEYNMYNTVRSDGVLPYIEMAYDTPFFDFAHALGACDDDVRSATFGLLSDAAFDDDINVEKQFGKLDAKADKALRKLYLPRN